MAGRGLALGIELHQVKGQLFQARLDLGLLLLPLAARKGVERRFAVGGADVLLHPVKLIGRHI